MVADYNYQDGFTTRHIAKNGKIQATRWGTNQFVSARLLLYNKRPKEWDPYPSSGFEKMALLTWVHGKLSEPDSQKFVLQYFDTNTENFLINQEGQLTYRNNTVYAN
jgi:hypothetical protein